MTALTTGVGTTSATFPSAAQIASGQGTLFNIRASFLVGNNCTVPTGPTRINVNVSTTVYLVVESNFSGGTCSANGYLWAQRMR